MHPRLQGPQTTIDMATATRKLPIAFSERLASDWLFVIFAIFCENDSLPSPCVIVAGCTLTINPHC